MIKVEEKLYVNADVFFDKIAESIAYDITASTGKNVRPKQIHKGFSYTKDMKNKMKRAGRVKVTITDFEAPRIYKAKFESSQGINTISYEIEQLDEDHIGVTYMEDFSGASGAKSVNFKIMSFFYNRGAKKKAVKLLRNMESYIQNEAKEKSEATES